MGSHLLRLDRSLLFLAIFKQKWSEVLTTNWSVNTAGLNVMFLHYRVYEMEVHLTFNFAALVANPSAKTVDFIWFAKGKVNFFCVYLSFITQWNNDFLFFYQTFWLNLGCDPKSWWLGLGEIKEALLSFLLGHRDKEDPPPPSCPPAHSLPACNQPALCPPPVLCSRREPSPCKLIPHLFVWHCQTSFLSILPPSGQPE